MNDNKFNWPEFHKWFDIAFATYLTEVEDGSIHDSLWRFAQYSNRQAQGTTEPWKDLPEGIRNSKAVKEALPNDVSPDLAEPNDAKEPTK